MSSSDVMIEESDRLKELLDQSLVGTYIIQDGTFAYVNEKLAETFGYDRGEIIDTLGPLDLTAPEDQDKVQENIDKRFRGDRDEIRYQFDGRRKNGETFDVEVHGRRVTYQDEPALAGTLVDRSSEKRARDTLQILAWGVASHTGNQFFRLLAGYLAQILRVDHAFIGMFDERDTSSLSPLAVFSGGDIIDEPIDDLRSDLFQSLQDDGFTIRRSNFDAGLYPDSINIDLDTFAGMPVRNPSGRVIGLLAVLSETPLHDEEFIQDVMQILADRAGAEIERLRAERRIREKERNYRTVFNHVNEAIIVVDPEDCSIRDVNQQTLSMLGYSHDEMIKMKVFELTDPDPVFDNDQLEDFLCRSTRRTMDWKFRTRDGRDVWVEISAKPCELNGQERVLAVIRIIEHRKQRERLNTGKDEIDPVTGLPNRQWFRNHLQSLLNENPDDKLAILYLDLDDFKDINAAYGHEMGNKVLETLANRLLKVEADNLKFAHWEGDVFLATVTGLSEVSEVEGYIQTILDTLDEPLTLIDRDVHPQGSLGYAVYPDNGDTVDALINRADLAMFHAKQSSGTQYHRYEEGSTGSVRKRLELETEMRRALQGDQFLLKFQPIYDLKSGKLHSLEALIRWQHPERGLVSPGEFLPIAESKGLMPELDEWVLNRALDVGAGWYEEFESCCQLNINLSAKSFDRPHIAERVQEIVENHDLPANNIQLEITESMALQDFDHTKEVITELNEDNISVALDDFGTGYSSFGYLTELPLDVIKIDRTLVQLLGREDHREVVRLINSAANKMDLGVMAEGIETVNQLDRLRDYGCHYVQGFLLSRPVPNIVVNKILSENIDIDEAIDELTPATSNTEA